MVQHANNPYTWNEQSPSSSTPVFSGVLDITLKRDGNKMEIGNLSEPISLSLPCDKGQQDRPPNTNTHFFIKPSNGSNNFRYHPFIINTEHSNVQFKIVPEDGKFLQVFIQARRRPTETNHTYTQKIPDITSCHNSSKNCSSKYIFTITSKITGAIGLHYLGVRYIKHTDHELIHVRKRRDCTSHNGRQKRSCVGVKDPPTTPPPTPVTIVPTYNASTDANYTLTSEVSFCGYWDEQEERWSSEGCKVKPFLKLEIIQCDAHEILMLLDSELLC